MPTSGARSSVAAGQWSGRALGLVDERGPARVVTLVEQRDVVVDLDVAVDGRARSHAARIEADEVEFRRDVVGNEERGGLHELDPRAAGATGIEHERADPLARIGGGHTGDRDVDRVAVRLVVVAWHGERGALEVDADVGTLVVARTPVEGARVAGPRRIGGRGRVGGCGRVRGRGRVGGVRSSRSDSPRPTTRPTTPSTRPARSTAPTGAPAPPHSKVASRLETTARSRLHPRAPVAMSEQSSPRSVGSPQGDRTGRRTARDWPP